MGNEPAFAEEWFSLEVRYAHRRTDNEDEVEFKERLDTGGGPWVPQRAAWLTQWLPLAPEKKVINTEQMSEYQRQLMADLDLSVLNTEKLVLTLEDKEKCMVHYKNLQFYLSQGMHLKKVHRGALDGTIHQDEHGVPQAGKKRFWNGLRQADEQLSVWEDDGKPKKPHRCKDSEELGNWQDPQAGV